MKFLKCLFRARWCHQQIRFPSGQLHGRVTVVHRRMGLGPVFNSHCLGITERLFHLCILVCRWSLVGPWQLGWCRVLRVSADTWCGLLEPLHLPGRGSWQPHPHSLGLESAIRHLPALLPSPPSTSGRVEYVEEGLGSTSALHPWEGPGCDGEVWD